jgi:predicted O-methyltransferase YrrM/heat shock protein HslJ
MTRSLEGLVRVGRPAAVVVAALWAIGCGGGDKSAAPVPPPASPDATSQTAPAAPANALAGTTWRFVEFQSMDDATGTTRPSEPSLYTMQLSADGSVAMRLNCNRATGTWKVEPSADPSNGRFEFGLLATTRALCPPPSLDEQLAAHAEHVRGYLLKDGRLYLSLMADAGILVWEPQTDAVGDGRDEVPPEAAGVLAAIKKVDTELYSVSEEDGRFLRVLVGARGATRVLEIGAARGYSAIWMGLGLRDTGGALVTVEYDAERARETKANVEQAGLASTVRVIAGDAFVEIPKLSGTFDLVFLDAWKPDYKKFFDLVFPRLDPGGVFVAHNVVNKRAEMKDFLQAITSRSDAWTTIVSPSGEGMSLTYKRRR